MLRQTLRRLIAAGIRVVARRPLIHRLVKAAYPLLPGLRPLLRRFLPPVAVAVAAPAPDVDAMLAFDRSSFVAAPGGVVTVEELFVLCRPV